jgi:hypothetical protein
MKRMLRPALLALGLLAVGCGGDDGPAGPSGGGGGGAGGNAFTGTIDGQPWKADANAIAVSGSATPTRQGTLTLIGINTATGVSVSLTLSFIVGPATQPLGVNITNPGGIASVVNGSKSWLTPLSGAAGFVTITARTSTRIAGTFFFTADANVGTTPATTTVTNGAFDITVAAGLPDLPTGVGSTTIANLGGTPWNAATIVGTNPGAGVFAYSASNTDYSLTITPKMPVSAGNTYGIPSQIAMTVIQTGGGSSWWGGLGADVGTLTITTFDANRMIATFSATLPPLSGASSLAVTGGAINKHL